MTDKELNECLPIVAEALRAAEMRQGCTDYTPYAEILLKQLIPILRQAVEDKAYAKGCEVTTRMFSNAVEQAKLETRLAVAEEIANWLLTQGAVWVDRNFAIIEAIRKGKALNGKPSGKDIKEVK